MSVTQEMIAEFETKHKRIAHVKGSGEPTPWEIVLRKPMRAEYKQFRSQAHNAGQVADAQEILVRKIAVFPVGDALDAMIEDWPAIPEACGKAINELAGVTTAADSK